MFPRINAAMFLFGTPFFNSRVASQALASVVKGRSVLALLGAGDLPDQTLFPFVATENSAFDGQAPVTSLSPQKGPAKNS